MSRIRITALVLLTVAAMWLLTLILAATVHSTHARQEGLRWNRLQLLGTDLLFVALLAAAGRLWLRGRARSALEDSVDELPTGGLRRGKYPFGTDPVSRRAGRQVRPGAALGFKTVRRQG